MLSPLPTKSGVSPSYIWLPQGKWTTIYAFLCDHFAQILPEVWQQRMAASEVKLQSGEVVDKQTPYKQGLCVFYYREIAEEKVIPFKEQILYQDDHLLVVDKPHFLPVIPTGKFLKETLLVRLKKTTGIDDLVPLHRLDRETAGVMLFSVSPQSRGLYQSLFQQRQIHKTYEAVAFIPAGLQFPITYQSRLERGQQFFLTEEVEGEPNAETRFVLLEDNAGLGRFEVLPVTGKKHQIRVHMASLGMPIKNDQFYPDTVAMDHDDNYDLPLQLLAKSIAFEDPITHEQRQFFSQLSLSLA